MVLPSESVLQPCPELPLLSTGSMDELVQVLLETAGEYQECKLSKQIVVDALRESTNE